MAGPARISLHTTARRCRRACFEDADGLPSGDNRKAGTMIRVTAFFQPGLREGSGMTSPWAGMSSRQKLDRFRCSPRAVDHVALASGGLGETGASRRDRGYRSAPEAP